MKAIYKLTFMLATLALTLVGCEKADTPTGDIIGGDNTPKERTIIYAVSQSENRQNLKTEAEWDALLDRFCDQALRGSEVVFYNMDQTTYLQGDSKSDTKDTRNINTTSRDEIKAWMKEMEKEGRTVRITYDEGTGTWHGEAYATLPSDSISGDIIGTWHFICMVVSHIGTDGHLTGSDLYEPEAGGGSMYYTFASDSTLTLTFNGMGGTTASESSTWSLSADGVLCSDLLPSGECWNVNWTSPNTMILSRENLGTEEGDLLYQLQFSAAE